MVPESLKSFMGQRSRWCKGSVQILLCKDTPLFRTGLPMASRMLYTGGPMNYFSAFYQLYIILTLFVMLTTGAAPLGQALLLRLCACTASVLFRKA